MPRTASLRSLIHNYYKNLEEIESTGSHHEGTSRQAMARLLSSLSFKQNLKLVEGMSRKPYGQTQHIVYDGVLIRKRDGFDFGYWEAKNQDKHLDRAIQEKIQAGYSLMNTFFENTQKAVLYQDGKKVLQANMKDSLELERILVQFFLHDQKIFDDFQSEKEHFVKQIEAQAEKLFRELEQKKKDHAPFQEELVKFHEYL